MTTKTNTLTEADRKQTAIVGEFAGGSSSQNIARALNEGDFALTGDQIKGLAKKAPDTQDNPSGKKVSNTTKFINRLDRQVEQKKGRYIALCHEVKETSLIWIDKADERDTLRCSKRKKVLEKGGAITKAELCQRASCATYGRDPYTLLHERLSTDSARSQTMQWHWDDLKSIAQQELTLLIFHTIRSLIRLVFITSHLVYYSTMTSLDL